MQTLFATLLGILVGILDVVKAYLESGNFDMGTGLEAIVVMFIVGALARLLGKAIGKLPPEVPPAR